MDDKEASFMVSGLSEKIGNIEKILLAHVQKFLPFFFPYPSDMKF